MNEVIDAALERIKPIIADAYLKGWKDGASYAKEVIDRTLGAEDEKPDPRPPQRFGETY